MAEQKQQPSFIPNKQRMTGRGRSANAYTIAGYLIFSITLLAGGVLYGTNYLLEQEIRQQAAELDDVDSVFSDQLFEEARLMDARLRGARKLLDDNLAPSQIFTILEDLTAVNVQFSDFSYQGSPGQAAELSMRAVTESFGAAAFQSELLRESQSISSLEISDLGIRDNLIQFRVRATVDADLYSYFDN